MSLLCPKSCTTHFLRVKVKVLTMTCQVRHDVTFNPVTPAVLILLPLGSLWPSHAGLWAPSHLRGYVLAPLSERNSLPQIFTWLTLSLSGFAQILPYQGCLPLTPTLFKIAFYFPLYHSQFPLFFFFCIIYHLLIYFTSGLFIIVITYFMLPQWSKYHGGKDFCFLHWYNMNT